MVLLVQGFSESTGGSALLVAKGLLIAAVAIVLIVISASYVIPKLFNEVVKLRNREVFILTIVLVCLGTAWLASLADYRSPSAPLWPGLLSRKASTRTR